MQVYPNPAKAFTAVSYGAKGNKHLEVYNMLGIKLQTVELKNEAGNFQLNTSLWPAGIYQLMLRENGRVLQTIRLLVE